MLGSFLREVTDEVLATAEPEACARVLHSHASGAVLPATAAGPVGRIVAELVTNAINYAHPTGVWGRIDVRSRATQPTRSLCIEVRDDGVGLPEAFDPRVDGGLGLAAVRVLAEKLGAKLRFIDSGVGLSVCLDLPGLN